MSGTIPTAIAGLIESAVLGSWSICNDDKMISGPDRRRRYEYTHSTKRGDSGDHEQATTKAIRADVISHPTFLPGRLIGRGRSPSRHFPPLDSGGPPRPFPLEVPYDPSRLHGPSIPGPWSPAKLRSYWMMAQISSSVRTLPKPAIPVPGEPCLITQKISPSVR